MKFRFPLVLLALVAVVATAWWAQRDPEFAASRSQAAPAVLAASPAARRPAAPLAASSVLSINPRAARPPAAAPRRTLFNEYLAAKSYRALYDRLRSSPEGQTPEGWYVMYEMLQRCATVPDRTTRGPRNRASDTRREDFIAAIPLNDPQRDKRIAAFDAVSANPCEGMQDITVKQADLDKLLADAAAGGDAKARAMQLEQSLWSERRAAGAQGGWGRASVTVTDAQVETLRDIAASKDPEAMVIAGRVLSGNWANFAVRIGPDQQLIEPRAFNQAWQLLACDYGYPCDTSNARVQSACAYQGHCNAQSLPDYIYYYGASPNDSQLMSQYHDILHNAIETGNWSQVSIARGMPDAAYPGNRLFGRGTGG